MDPSLPLIADAERRDFTINALYRKVCPAWVGPSVLVDPTGRGLYDLQHRFLNTTHPDSFRDDPLRILRALRFVSVLGYDLGTNTLDQMREHSHAVNGLTRRASAARRWTSCASCSWVPTWPARCGSPGTLGRWGAAAGAGGHARIRAGPALPRPDDG